MLDDLFSAVLIVSLMSAMLRIATPILLGALGELVTEKSGIINLSIEGTMIMGAFTSFWAAQKTGSLALGILAALVAGGTMALIMAFMTVTLRVNQIVTGLALNLLGPGMSFYLYRVSYLDAVYGDLPKIDIFKNVKIPLLSNIPIFGEVIFSQDLLTYVAFAMVPIIGFFLYKTKFGLRIRTVGENPRVIDMRGLSPSRLRYGAVVFGGLLMGLGGSYLTLASTGLFLPGMTAGRGWLSYVIVIAGNWQLKKILIMALVFSLLDSFQLHLQGLGYKFPFQILLALPYIFAIVATALSRTRSGAPEALGEPYIRD